MQSTPLAQGLDSKSVPAPIAPELLKFIGGGVKDTTSAPTPQAPKSTW